MAKKEPNKSDKSDKSDKSNKPDNDDIFSNERVNIRWCLHCKDFHDYTYKCANCHQAYSYSEEIKGLFHKLQGIDQGTRGRDDPEWNKQRKLWNRLASLLGMDWH